MEECKGCTSLRPHRLHKKKGYCSAGVILQSSETYSCPCSICLVKTMCNTACEDFQTYKSLCRAKVNRINREVNNNGD